VKLYILAMLRRGGVVHSQSLAAVAIVSLRVRDSELSWQLDSRKLYVVNCQLRLNQINHFSEVFSFFISNCVFLLVIYVKC